MVQKFLSWCGGIIIINFCCSIESSASFTQFSSLFETNSLSTLLLLKLTVAVISNISFYNIEEIVLIPSILVKLLAPG